MPSETRAQTVQDFAVGASVFLLTVGFVFAFVPSLFTPFESQVGAAAESQADATATAMVTDLSEPGQPGRFDETATARLMEMSDDQLRNRYGLPRTAQLNVTLQPTASSGPVELDTTNAPAAAGDAYYDRPAASVTRVVVVEGESDCDPATGDAEDSACRLIVRVW
jgi:hypothetical protein